MFRPVSLPTWAPAIAGNRNWHQPALATPRSSEPARHTNRLSFAYPRTLVPFSLYDIARDIGDDIVLAADHTSMPHPPLTPRAKPLAAPAFASLFSGKASLQTQTCFPNTHNAKIEPNPQNCRPIRPRPARACADFPIFPVISRFIRESRRIRVRVELRAQPIQNIGVAPLSRRIVEKNKISKRERKTAKRPLWAQKAPAPVPTLYPAWDLWQ